MDLEAVAPLLPLLEAMVAEHADEESVSGPAQLLLGNVERATRLHAGDPNPNPNPYPNPNPNPSPNPNLSPGPN